jgi:hypothetical protein
MKRVVRSMVQWGVLADSDQHGVYAGAKEPIPVPATMGELLLEALLMRHDGESLPVDQALRHPCLFPFHIELRVHQLRRSARFDVHRQGLDVDVVTFVRTMADEAFSRAKSSKGRIRVSKGSPR